MPKIEFKNTNHINPSKMFCIMRWDWVTMIRRVT